MTKKISEVIRERIKADNGKFYANSNISKYIKDGERQKLISEITDGFEGVLQSLIIDTENDPNSQDTARRLAKMYVNELFQGRYDPEPKVTAFPNMGQDAFRGMLCVRSEITSMCSHHHQPVKGLAVIGVIPSEKVIGLSKYTRIAQHLARRGTLQEELTNDIASAIMSYTESEHVGVWTSLNHGCCENRGILAHNSMTQCTVLKGEFRTADVKKEFFDNIKMQSQYRCD